MLDDIQRERRKKLERYREVANPYPAETKRSATLGKVAEAFASHEKAGKLLTLAGRIKAWRDQGKIIFADVEDESGSLQFVLDPKDLGKGFDVAKETFDIGDFVEAEGKAFTTKRGEKSLQATRIRLLAKSLRPIPAERYGLKDEETRLRKRYLDLLTHPELRELFRKKQVFWATVRAELEAAGFLEVETPVLEAVPGGADAEPFTTHHNALDREFYLRISLELALKRLMVGGFEKVFEIGRIFRNEGIDRVHLQDYTQMECYAAFWDYKDMMQFVEALYRAAIKKTFGSLTVTVQGKKLDWGKAWPKVDYYTIFKKETGLDPKETTQEELHKKAVSLGLKPENGLGRGRLIDLIFKKTARPKLTEPCFLVDPPFELVPLAKRLEKNPDRVARFQVVALGTELGNGFSELNDPVDQRARFEEQMKLRAAGDKEAQQLDEDYLEAMEYGMPPTSGFGMSERLFAVLADVPIREAVLFPLMKEEQ